MEVQTLFQFLFRVSVTKFFLSNSKKLFFSTISASSISVLFEICLLSLDSKSLRRQVRPSLRGMLGERTTMSIIHRITP